MQLLIATGYIMLADITILKNSNWEHSVITKIQTLQGGILCFALLVLIACTAEKPQLDDETGLPFIIAKQQALTADASAHWLALNTLFLQQPFLNDKRYFLVSGDNALPTKELKNSKLDDYYAKKYPHLVNVGGVFSFAETISASEAKQLLKHGLYIVVVNKQQQLHAVHNVQTGNVIDDLYTSGLNDADEISDFGATQINHFTQFKLWAPTARAVTVKLFNSDKSPATPAEIALTFDQHNGTWSAQAKQDLSGYFYQYQIQLWHNASKQLETIITTDPYSLSLSVNSEHSQVVDLNAAMTMPTGWAEHQTPVVKNLEDNVFYELHIGDFSGNDSSVSSPAVQGKYQAFAETNSDGIKHLKRLHAAGLNNIHLLPSFDIGTVNEDLDLRLSLDDSITKLCDLLASHSLCHESQEQTPEYRQQSIKSLLKGLDPSSAKAQEIISQLRTFDDYNWGYDPFHYTVPEGSYAQNPDGVARVIEFREMVQNLHNLGFRVIMDVVYNHTHQAGLEATSVLDKIVPGYYQRLNPITGKIEQSTCCDNTATERKMMAKLMTDSLVVWARDYRIDGFRFDLMAHQPKSLMLTARDAVKIVDPDSYFYGEGWNFGEVANNQRFVQASQLELAGTEIGTFTDRLRDAVRGSGMTAVGDGIRKQQGIGNGLLTVPNELRSVVDSKAQYLLYADQLRVGLAANLAMFAFENSQNAVVLGKDIPYGEQPTGYALDPADTINYVSKHDNQTLWDNNQYRNNFSLSIEQRVRMHTLSLSYPLLAQGIPFIHMGSEFLRSKSYLRDSYDYGHWFNKVDFSQQTNNYNVGLPPAEKDQQNWPLISKVIAGNEGRDNVSPAHINTSITGFEELLKIRMGSPLFRLTSAKAINEQVSFLNTGSNQRLGLIVMRIVDDNQIDQHYQQIVVIFNSSANSQTFAFDGAEQFILHPVQAHSSNPITGSHRADAKGFTVHGFSAAVFVLTD